MSTIAPSSSQTPIGATPVGTPASVQIELNGTSLSADVGNIITGTVLGRDPRGAVQLRTQNGIILLHTAAKLPPGATVTLQVQAVGAQIQAILLQVTPLSAQVALPLIDTATLPGHAPSAGTAASGPGAPASQVAIGTGPTVTATVIGPVRDARSAGATPMPHANPAPQPTAERASAATPNAPSVTVAGRPPADGVIVQSSLPSGAPQVAHAPADRSAAIERGAPPAVMVRSAATAEGAAASPGAGGASAAAAPTGLPGTPGRVGAAVAAIASMAEDAALAPSAAVGPPSTAGRTAAGMAPSSLPSPVLTIDDAPASVGAQATAHAYAAAQTVRPGRTNQSATVAVATASGAAAGPPATAVRLDAAPPQPGTGPATPSPSPDRQAAAIPAHLAAGSELDVRVTRLGEAQIQTAAPGHPQIAGTIAGRTPSGQAIVDTSAGRLAVTLPAALGPAQDGMRLMLDVVATRVAAPLPHEAPPRAALEAASLRPMLDAFTDVARASRGHVDPHDILPRPGPQLAQRLADVAAALSTGNVAEWLGERTVKSIEQRGHGETLRRLEGELYEAAKAAPQSPEWHGTVLPFFVGGQLQPLRLYVRRRNARARDRAAGTRFVLECAHDDLGELQLDGLVHERRIDVILRTHAALPEDMRGDIVALFGDACGVMGYAGTIEFHAEPAFPAMPRIERAAHSIGVVA